MPLTFIDIEKQKNWRIWLFFLFLMLVYFAVAAALGLTVLPVRTHDAHRVWIFAGLVALLAAAIHFWFSAYDTVQTVIRSLNAQPPDPQDDVHTMLANVMQEIHVVTGNRRKIGCVVIPTLSMNALAAADLKGEAVIGITEGLLSRLTRPQLETVLAHEAHHILSGDCLETTVAASLFGAYSAVIEKVGRASNGRSYASPAFLLAWVLLQLSNVLNMFISREREYRADAASVRMTRNPIALAETLHLLSRSWRGAGFIGGGFEMLCIVNPEMNLLDETEGFLADLLSTHPPLRKRMDVLLRMARVSITELDSKAARRNGDTSPKTPEPRYYAMNPQQQWQGPFALSELGTLPWLTPLTWITTGDQEPVDRAWKDPLINAVFTAQLTQKDKPLSAFTCPVCSQPLVTTPYEGTQVFRCSFCAGTLVENGKIPRIIARTQQPCTERVNALARTVMKENQLGLSKQMLSGEKRSMRPLHPCPKCKNRMNRNFYSLAYLIEVDRCGFCGLTWFDQDELEMLQCLIENKLVSEATMLAGPTRALAE